MAFCNTCIRPVNSSIVTHHPRPTPTLKSLLHCQLFKKSSKTSNSRPTVPRKQSSSRFQRIRGSNLVREINPNTDPAFPTNSTNNYDMTILHADQLDDTHISSKRRPSKQIPPWARKSQLQLAFINQVYFNERNPEDIFGSIQLDLAREMVQSMELNKNELSVFSCTSMLPPNFV